jgi:hypothetical protein
LIPDVDSDDDCKIVHEYRKRKSEGKEKRVKTEPGEVNCRGILNFTPGPQGRTKPQG